MFEKKDYRLVGNSSLLVSPITLGTMTFGDQNTQEEAFHQLDFAIDQGINCLDVAELYPVPPKADTYTKTEIIIGNWLKYQKREELVLSTKVAGPRRDLSWIRGGPLSLDRKNIIESVEKSLQRLQTDYVDLLYLHWPERNVPMFGQYKFDPEMEYRDGKKINWVSIEEQLNTLSELVSSGKARFIALSNEWSWGVMEFIRIAREKGLPVICNIQNNYSLLNRVAELGLTEIMYREGISFFPYSPLADMGVSPTSLALSFVYHQWFVKSTVIGATSIEQLKENIEAYALRLDDSVLKRIDDIHLRCMNPAP
jgi:aryl-alcohol dehydrogenase-like predicted oxidoreductase